MQGQSLFGKTLCEIRAKGPIMQGVNLMKVYTSARLSQCNQLIFSLPSTVSGDPDMGLILFRILLQVALLAIFLQFFGLPAIQNFLANEVTFCKRF